MNSTVMGQERGQGFPGERQPPSLDGVGGVKVSAEGRGREEDSRQKRS